MLPCHVGRAAAAPVVGVRSRRRFFWSERRSSGVSPETRCGAETCRIRLNVAPRSPASYATVRERRPRDVFSRPLPARRGRLRRRPVESIGSVSGDIPSGRRSRFATVRAPSCSRLPCAVDGAAPRALACRRTDHPPRRPEGRRGPRGDRRGRGGSRAAPGPGGSRRRARRCGRAARARRHRRRGGGRRGGRLLPRRHTRRGALRGARPDRRALRLADRRAPGPPRHRRPRRAVLPPRHPPDLRHAPRGDRPLRPRAPRGRRDARVAGQPVRVPGGRRAAGPLLCEPAFDPAAGARLRGLHATRAAGGAHRSAVGDQRGRVDPQPALGAALQG